MTRIPLPRSFYLRNTHDVAKELLGKELFHCSSDGAASGFIVEVEAYIGPDDAASHTYKGIRSNRTEVFYGIGGMAYIYLIYGIHHCFNVVTGEENRPEAILVRALEPSTGIELMARRRGKKIGPGNLSNGPGKLCQALGITMSNYGDDLCNGSLFIANSGIAVSKSKIMKSKRINIDYAGKAKDYLWRYSISGNPYVSVKADT